MLLTTRTKCAIFSFWGPSLVNLSVSVYVTKGAEPLVLIMADGEPIVELSMQEAHGLALVIQKMIFKSTPEVEFIEDNEDACKEC